MNDSSYTDTLTMKYLEPGHTFMAADSVHGNITCKLNTSSQGEVHDFRDFVRVIKSSRKKMEVIPLDHHNMFLFKNQSKSKVQVLVKNVKVAQFRRGSLNMFVKSSHDDSVFKEVEIFKRSTLRELQSALLHGKSPLSGVPKIECPRGIPLIKNNDLLKLAMSMPPYKHEFFDQLRVNDT